MHTKKIFAESYDWEYRNKKRDILFYSQLAKRFKGPILEVGCGTGRITKILAEEKIQTVGIDTDREVLKLARRKLRNTGHEKYCSFLFGDITKFVQTSPFGHRLFQVVLFPFDVFSYLGVSCINQNEKNNPTARAVLKTQKEVLEWTNQQLRPNGVIVIDIFTEKQIIEPDVVRHHYTRPLFGQKKISCFSSFHPSKKSCYFELRFVLEVMNSSGNSKRFYHTLHGYQVSAAQLTILLQETGFKVLEVYDNYNYRKCNIGDEREGVIIIAGHK